MTYLPVSRTSCVPTQRLEYSLVRWIARSIESSISMLSPLPTRNTILLEGFTRTAPMFHHVLFYYFLYWLRNFCRFTIERAWLWFVLRPDNLGGLDVVSFFRTLTLKKEKWERWDLIVAEKGFVLLISSNFTPRNLHTKVKLSKGRENWSKANKEWETVEIFFRG